MILPRSQMSTEQDCPWFTLRSGPVCICRGAQGTQASTQVEQLQTSQLPCRSFQAISRQKQSADADLGSQPLLHGLCGQQQGSAAHGEARRAPLLLGGLRRAAGPGARRGGGRRGRLLLLPRGHGGGGGASGAAGARSPPLTRKLAHTSRNRNRHRSDP